MLARLLEVIVLLLVIRAVWRVVGNMITVSAGARRTTASGEPRAVKLGMRGDGYVEVLDGIREGEEVVVSANFLIDAESNLKAALQSFSQGAQP